MHIMCLGLATSVRSFRHMVLTAVFVWGVLVEYPDHTHRTPEIYSDRFPTPRTILECEIRLLRRNFTTSFFEKTAAFNKQTNMLTKTATIRSIFTNVQSAGSASQRHSSSVIIAMTDRSSHKSRYNASRELQIGKFSTLAAIKHLRF